MMRLAYILLTYAREPEQKEARDIARTKSDDDMAIFP